MDMWGFTSDFFARLDTEFIGFLDKYRKELSSEFVLPDIIDTMLKKDSVSVQVLPTEDWWFGMTCREDLPVVQAAFLELAQQGVYQRNLFDTVS